MCSNNNFFLYSKIEKLLLLKVSKAHLQNLNFKMINKKSKNLKKVVSNNQMNLNKALTKEIKNVMSIFL